MAALIQRIESSIQNRGLLPRGAKVLIAVSGGLDSMALLQALHQLAPKYRWQLTVAHFNHRLRGRSSAADERLVRRTAAKLKLPVMFERADVKRFASAHKLSIEMAARQLRHDFFARTARRSNIRIVALAHHADDQVELFFLRVLRGAGGEGLAGMKWRTPSPAAKGIDLIRPLLDLTKPELLAFAKAQKFKYREDATNAGADFLRNRIRNELIPLLQKEYQPGIAKTVLRLMDIVGAEAEVVGGLAGTWLARPEPSFAQLPVAVQRRVLQAQLLRLNVPSDFELIEALRVAVGVAVTVSPQVSVKRNENGKVELAGSDPAVFNLGETSVDLTGRAGRVKFDGLALDWKFAAGTGVSGARNRVAGECFDASRVGDQIVLRHWRPGDRFQPIGMAAPAKLQDLFTNQKIPRGQRHKLVVAATAGGEIFWVEGLRMAERFKLGPQTRRRLVWRWQRPAGGVESIA